MKGKPLIIRRCGPPSIGNVNTSLRRTLHCLPKGLLLNSLPLPTAGDRPVSSLLTVTQDLGASEEWLETSSMSSRSGIEDGMSIGSARSEASPKHCVALYNYTVRYVYIHGGNRKEKRGK